MSKRLLSSDCTNIVLEAFKLLDIDLKSFYQDIVDEYSINDDKIIEKLKLAVNSWMELYKTEINKYALGVNRIVKGDEVIWEIVAEKDRYMTKILLFEKWDIPTKVNLAFFEKHLKTLEEIEKQVQLKKLEIQINILESISAKLEKLPVNNSRETFLPLPECFKETEKNLWSELIQDPRLQDYYVREGSGKYRWTGNKNLLSGLAFRLLNKRKLKDNIVSGQDLAKIFCSYFGVDFDPNDDRTFRPERALIHRFDWIN